MLTGVNLQIHVKAGKKFVGHTHLISPGWAPPGFTRARERRFLLGERRTHTIHHRVTAIRYLGQHRKHTSLIDGVARCQIRLFKDVIPLFCWFYLMEWILVDLKTSRILLSFVQPSLLKKCTCFTPIGLELQTQLQRHRNQYPAKSTVSRIQKNVKISQRARNPTWVWESQGTSLDLASLPPFVHRHCVTETKMKRQLASPRCSTVKHKQTQELFSFSLSPSLTLYCSGDPGWIYVISRAFVGGIRNRI